MPKSVAKKNKDPVDGPQQGQGQTDSRPAFSGADIGIHLIVCVLVGGGLGYAFDLWLHSSPWGMLGGGMAGFAAWLRAIWKILRDA